MEERFQSEELKRRAKPLIDLLIEEGHPYISIVVNENYIKVVEDTATVYVQEND